MSCGVGTTPHDGPLYRVVPARFEDPLDTSFSIQRPDRRWNQLGGHRVLYTCCSIYVARTIARDFYVPYLVDPRDLQPGYRPVLAEIGWVGEVVDIASPSGVAEAGFPASYPRGVDCTQTQPRAAIWHAAGHEGVLCRSASLERLGVATWSGSRERWTELALFEANVKRSWQLRQIRTDLTWFDGPLAEEAPG